MILIPLSVEKSTFACWFSATSVPPDLTTSATALSKPALYILLTFQVPNLIPIFFHLGCLSKESVQVRGFLSSFVTKLFLFSFLCAELLAPRQIPKVQDHPLSSGRDCVFSIFAATLHIWEPSPPSAT
jgi:hypothetical protein